MPQSPHGWHVEQIKAALRMRFGPLRQLSRTWGLHHSAITNTLSDPAYSVPTEKRIALCLGVVPQELWPDRWDASTGQPLPRPSSAHRKPASIAKQRQKARAA